MANIDRETNGLMRIGVFVDPRRIWRWHLWLTDALLSRSHQTDIFSCGVCHPMPARLRLLLRMEKIAYQHESDSASEQIPLDAFDQKLIREKPARSGYDLVIDLAGDTRLQAFKCRRFRPLFDGLPGDAHLINLLMQGRRPRLALDDSALPEPRRFGLCAVEQPEVVLKALNNVYSRVAGALLKAVDEICDDLVTTPPDALSDMLPGVFAGARTIAGKASLDRSGARQTGAGKPGAEKPGAGQMGVRRMGAKKGRGISGFSGASRKASTSNALAAVLAGAQSGVRTQYNRRRSAPMHPGVFFIGSISSKLSGRLNRLAGCARRWGVGWRHTDGQSARQSHSLTIGDYNRLPDDCGRIFADPFIVWRDGRHHLFVEDYSYKANKGHISHFSIDANGALSGPQLVLSRPYHIAYPFIFRHQGTFFMIPETSGNRAVELYRAVRFPDKWVLETTLMTDVRLHNVTLTQWRGRWWMFAAISDWQSSSRDALALFSADDLFGPWKPHQGNPVLLDARAARPAGAMYEQDGALYRPAQDCSGGYGVGLSLCKVERLDDEGYEQSVAARFQPTGERRLRGLHTLNEAHGLEVIDFFGRF